MEKETRESFSVFDVAVGFEKLALEGIGDLRLDRDAQPVKL
jgi:hypothetical protein